MTKRFAQAALPTNQGRKSFTDEFRRLSRAVGRELSRLERFVTTIDLVAGRLAVYLKCTQYSAIEPFQAFSPFVFPQVLDWQWVVKFESDSLRHALRAWLRDLSSDSQAQRWRGIGIVYRCTMALLTGLLAMVLVFATLASLSRELFASGGGLFLGLAMAHVVGTTVARAMLPGSPPTARVIIHASGLALLYALLLVLTTVAFYAVLAYAAPRLFGSTVGLVMAAIVAHAACAVVTRRRDSAWAQTAGPLWLAGVMLVTAYLFLVSRESA